MRLASLLEPRRLTRRSLQRLGPALRRVGLGRALDIISPPPDPYELWRYFHAISAADRRDMATLIARLPNLPTFSIIMPVCDPPIAYLHAAVTSVQTQLYPHWELCIADDASVNADVRAYLAEVARDRRVKLTWRAQRGGIAAATNDALDRARGSFAAFLDHDDVLAEHALYRFGVAAIREPAPDLMYSDEDKICDDPPKHYDPYFKPDWSPETLLSRMYIGHLLAIRRTLIADVHSMRPAYDGSQDYDLVLRVTERTERIVHIPDVLYHWRAHAQSAAAVPDAKPYAVEAAAAALRDALKRRGTPGSVDPIVDRSGRYQVRFTRPVDDAVTIIIPTRDQGVVLERCLASIFARSTHRNFEVLAIDNGSVEVETAEVITHWLTREPLRFRVQRDPQAFNFSALNNAAVRGVNSPFVVFLNDDTEVITPDWLEALLEYAGQPAIGAVGPLLLYPDGRVQHAGVVLGIGGLAGHIFKRFPASAGGYYDALQTVTNYSAVTAACLMVRREVFEAAGGFDESLPIAWNDIDFCLRVRAAGHRNVYIPHARLVHYESLSRGDDTAPRRRIQVDLEVQRLRSRWGLERSGDPYYNPSLTLVREDCTIGP